MKQVPASCLLRNSANDSRLYLHAVHSTNYSNRRGSARRASVDGDRPLSAPPTKPPVPKQRPRSSLGERNDGSGKPTKSRRRSYVGQPVCEKKSLPRAVLTRERVGSTLLSRNGTIDAEGRWRGEELEETKLLGMQPLKTSTL